jgi:hypothetical protein
MEFCPLFASPALSDFPEALAPNGDKLHLEPLILIYYFRLRFGVDLGSAVISVTRFQCSSLTTSVF